MKLLEKEEHTAVYIYRSQVVLFVLCLSFDEFLCVFFLLSFKRTRSNGREKQRLRKQELAN